jgi:hypothetical protein
MAILKAKELDWPHVTIFEDDAYPRNNVRDDLDAAIAELPEGKCQVFLPGYSYAFNNGKVDDLLISGFRGYGSHSYTVFRNSYDRYLKVLDDEKVADGPFFFSTTENHVMTINEFFAAKEPLFVQFSINDSISRRSGFLWFKDAHIT